MNVLIVEDDPGISTFLAKGLKAEGYAVATAANGDEAGSVAGELGGDLDLVLLDLSLPGASGFDLLRDWRDAGLDVPIIILTASGEMKDKVRGLDGGATDYVTKPFVFDELLARIRAALRTAGQVSTTQLVVGDLRLDLLAKVAWRQGRRIDLAPREWALLELFMRNPHQILSRTQILNHVWEYSFDPGSNVVDVYVGYLRRKLNVGSLPALVQTVRGAGYRLVPPDPEPAG